jgi:hypothetical protein
LKYFLCILFIILISSSLPFLGFNTKDIEYFPCYNCPPEYSPNFKLPLLTDKKLNILYKYSRKYGVNPMYIASINYAETVMGKWKIHKNPTDKGEFGLHESKAIRLERIEKWGKYNPDIYDDSCRIATLELKEELDYFNTIEEAFSAYNTGRFGTESKGINKDYLKSIYKYFNKCQNYLTSIK